MKKVSKKKAQVRPDKPAAPKKESVKRNLLKRFLSALVLLPVVLGAVYLGYPVLTFFLIILSALMAYEWEQMTNGGKTTKMALMMTVWLSFINIVWLTWMFMVSISPYNAWAATSVIIGVQAFLMALPVIFFAISKKSGYAHPKLLLFGCYYMAVPMLVMPFLGTAQLFAVLAVVWLTDIGGWLFGKAIGGKKIFPKTSPGKTWAGSIGGVVLAMLGFVYFAVTFKEYAAYILGGVAVLSVAAQAGDYMESKVKRKLGIKDSGNLIPGHGGVFDRIDSLLLAIPVAVIMILVWSSFAALPGVE